MTALSVLDLMMIGEDKTFAHTLDEAVALARHVETHGYKRYWIAEHHDLPGIASSATSLLIQHLAANTTTLRVGAGGIMLPNHSPLTVAEHFGTLDTLFPGVSTWESVAHRVQPGRRSGHCAAMPRSATSPRTSAS